MGYIRVEVQELISNVLLITMGVEFTALFGHNLPEDVILKGENFLNHHWGGTQEYLPILDACPVPDSPIPLWQWDKRWGYSPQEDLQKYGFISFVNDGFRVRIGENTFYLWNVVRWHRFLTEERISTTLRHICQLLATILQTDKVIYLPDSGFSVSTVYDNSVNRN